LYFRFGTNVQFPSSGGGAGGDTTGKVR